MTGINYKFKEGSQLAPANDQNEGSLGEQVGLYGRMPSDLQKLVRKIMDAPNYDFGAMEILDTLGIEWRRK